MAAPKKHPFEAQTGSPSTNSLAGERGASALRPTLRIRKCQRRTELWQRTVAFRKMHCRYRHQCSTTHRCE